MIDDTNCSVMCELNNLKKTIQFLAFLVLFMAFFSQNFIHETIFQAYAGIQPQVMFQQMSQSSTVYLGVFQIELVRSNAVIFFVQPPNLEYATLIRHCFIMHV